MEELINEGNELRLKIDLLDIEINKKQSGDKKALKDSKARQLKDFVAKFKETDIKGWIENGFEDESPIVFAEFFGRYLAAKELSTSQIRNVFGEVKRLEMSQPFSFSQFLLLKPRLTYAAERKSTDGSRAFKDKMIPAINAVIAGNDAKEKQKRFENFASFFEAVLAYHRSFGGK